MNTVKPHFLSKFIGDKAFYKMVLGIAVPIMIQNGISNFVGLLDNIMIGQVGTEQMSGVAIVNQLFFIYYLCLFGAVAGAGIFTAQFFGQHNDEGIRQTIRYKIIIVTIISSLAILLFLCCGNTMIQLFLKGEGAAQSAADTLAYGRNYLLVMLVGLPPCMMVQVYASTLRECGQTVVPMKASIVAVFVNLILNYLLIFGKLGFPVLGVVGAAVATVISRYVEMIIVIVHMHRNIDVYPFVRGLYSTLKIPVSLVKKITIKGLPLMINETLWSTGMTMLTQCYSTRGLNVMASLNISNTINNLFNIVFLALGDSVAIVIGQLLGAGKMGEAKEKDTKMIAFSVFCCTIMATLMLIFSPLFPRLYNTSDDVRQLARQFIIVTAIFMPQGAFLHAAYFTLRSGGKTIVTFLFDSVFIWCVSVTIAYCLSRFTAMPVIAIYTCVNLGDLIKCTVGFILVKKGIWLQNIVNE